MASISHIASISTSKCLIAVNGENTIHKAFQSGKSKPWGTLPTKMKGMRRFNKENMEMIAMRFYNNENGGINEGKCGHCAFI